MSAAGRYPVLDALLGAGAARDFMKGPWPASHLVAHGSLERLPPVLCAAPLSGLDTLAPLHRGPVVFGRGAVDARTASAELDAPHLLRLGLAVYLPDIAPVVPGLAAWLRGFERELGLPEGCSTVGAFAAPPGDGVSCHFDADDVFSIQLRGRKVFHVAAAAIPYPAGRQFGPGMLPADELYPQAGGGFPTPDTARFERIEMAPGSVLFLPRGTWHRSEAVGESFSISIGIRPPSALDRLLPQLRDLLLQDPAWRRPLYEAHRPGDAAIDRAAALLAGLPAILSSLTADDLARPSTRDHYQKIPMSTLAHAREGGRLRLVVTALDGDWSARTTLDTQAPAHLAPSLAWLAAREAAFDAADFDAAFPRLPGPDRQQVLALLVRASFLRRLWFPARSDA